MDDLCVGFYFRSSLVKQFRIRSDTQFIVSQLKQSLIRGTVKSGFIKNWILKMEMPQRGTFLYSEDGTFMK